MSHCLRKLSALTPLFLFAACRQDMHDQPRYEPMEASDFFANGSSMRLQVEGSVARGELRLDEHLYMGKEHGEFAKRYPMELSAEILDRGQQRYQIFCSACHGSTGDGEGMVVRRGMQQPPSYHIDRLRDVEHGYIFDVISNGFGGMYDMADRISHEDRWAIVAYVRALQLSQNASIEDVPGELRESLEGNR